MADDEAPEPKPKKPTKDKAALPFAEDSEKLDGRAWNRKPLMVLGVVLAVVVAVVLLFLALKDVTADSDDDGGDAPPPRVTVTTTTVPPTTTSTSSTTTSTTAPPATTTIPENLCEGGAGITDCIDPDGDGTFEIINGGAQCLATAEVPSDCIDSDNDGDAGPPATTD